MSSTYDIKVCVLLFRPKTTVAKKVTIKNIIIKVSFSYLPSSSENNFGYITGTSGLAREAREDLFVFSQN